MRRTVTQFHLSPAPTVHHAGTVRVEICRLEKLWAIFSSNTRLHIMRLEGFPQLHLTEWHLFDSLDSIIYLV
ncbi:unnamed protein product [Nesidiocoris tenuis]|uniref:Uncharacterized protein n=1 Tax=Nesidiocoris tenuis TaxID=355587 RepID=A0A6H5H054_9HEMI|nr:unnamed protein product [Nesidiocoris tenuis]